MKILIIALTLTVVSLTFGETLKLVVENTTFTTAPRGVIPKCSASIKLDHTLKQIQEAYLQVGDVKYIIPTKALVGIVYPDLSSAKIEVEKEKNGKIWYSILLKSNVVTEHSNTIYYISIVDGRFAQVCKIFDEEQGTLIERKIEILYKVDN